jgi:glucokinase
MTLVLQVSEGHQIKSIGVGIPGVVDSRAGLVVRTPNMPFDGLPLSAMLNENWPLPIFLSNDANAAALGEYISGAAQGASSMVMVTLGTGVGGGIIIDGRAVEGVGGAAAEIGHMVVCHDGLPCSCGRRGCWEMYASARALIRMTTETMKCHPDSLLHEALTGDPPCVSGRTAFLAASRADKAAQAVVNEYIDWLAEGILNIILILQPDIICIGGGISGEGNALLTPLRARIEERRFCTGIKQSKLEVARLGNDAGLIGAALLGVKSDRLVYWQKTKYSRGNF